MNPLIIVGLAIAGFAAWQQSQKSEAGKGTGTGSTDDGTKPLPKEEKPAAGESTESTTTDGKTVIVTTVDGTAKVEPTTDKSSTGSAGASARGFDSGASTRTGVLTAPAPQVPGAALRAATGATVGAIPNPFARVASSAYGGLVNATVDNTSRRQAVLELQRLGPSAGAMW